MSDLLPCPYACQVKRGPFIEVDQEEWDIARVVCGDCGSAGPFADLADYGGDEVEASERAVRMWNTRTPTESTRDGGVANNAHPADQ